MVLLLLCRPWVVCVCLAQLLSTVSFTPSRVRERVSRPETGPCVRCPAPPACGAPGGHTVRSNRRTTAPGWRTNGARPCADSRWRRATATFLGTGRAAAPPLRISRPALRACYRGAASGPRRAPTILPRSHARRKSAQTPQYSRNARRACLPGSSSSSWPPRSACTRRGIGVA